MVSDSNDADTSTGRPIVILPPTDDSDEDGFIDIIAAIIVRVARERANAPGGDYEEEKH